MKHTLFTLESRRRLLVLAFTLLSIAALALVNSKAVCAFDFCQDCQWQCATEAAGLYWDCRLDGGSDTECSRQEKQYKQNCNTVFCGGCGPIPN